MSGKVEISGLAGLNKVLQMLPVKLEQNVLRGALRAGAKTFTALAKQNAPVDDGDLQKSIRVSVKAKRGVVRASAKAGDATAFYAHMIEFGTATYYTGNGKSDRQPYKIEAKKNSALSVGGKYYKSITHHGVKPNPFMRNAFDSGQAIALNTFREYIITRLPKEIEKLKNK